MLGLVKHNIKILITPSYIIGWLFLLCLPFAFNFKLLNEMELARISEQVFIIVGIIWFCNLLHHEEVDNLTDLVYQMPVKQSLIFIIRLLIIFFSMIVAFTTLLLVAYIQGAVFNFLKLLMSSIIGALFLGTISMLFSQLTREIAVGYMVSFAYYYFELSTKGVYTKYFYLFGLLTNIPYNKVLLMGVCLFIIMINWIILNFRINGWR